MKALRHLLLVVASAAFFVGSAQAQNAGTITQHAFAIGKGAGYGGYTSLLCGSAQLAVGQAAADPICQTITGDATLSNSGALTVTKTNGVAFGIFATGTNAANLTGTLNAAQFPALTGDVTTTAGSLATTLATVNSNTGTFGSATAIPQVTFDGKGRATAVTTVPVNPFAQVASPTSNAIYKGQGASAPVASALSDDGSKVSTSEPIDLTSKTLVREVANAGTTGTTVNELAKLTGAPSTAVITATTDTGGVVGIVVAGAGTTGNALVAIAGQASCVFDGSTVAGDYVQISSTTAGNCHDIGSSYPTIGQVVARVLSTNTGGGTYVVDLGPEVRGGSGGASGVTSVNITAGTGAAVSGTCNSTSTINCQVSPDPTYLQGYISKLTLSNDAVTPNTILDIAAGVATSDDQAALMKLASAYTKTTGAWAVGSGNGALDTGTIAASNWYFVFLIERTDTGVVDILFSLSPTSPTMPTNYTKKRRIGAFATSSSNIRLFTQIGNKFTWNAPVSDVVATNPGTSAVLATLTVPAGIVVQARFVFYLQETAATRRTALITSPSIADTAPSPGTASSMTTGVAATAGAQSSEFNVWTNTSSQIRYRLDGSAATTNVFIMTEGWEDDL